MWHGYSPELQSGKKPTNLLNLYWVFIPLMLIPFLTILLLRISTTTFPTQVLPPFPNDTTAAASPVPFPNAPALAPFPNDAAAASPDSKECPSGKVYVYDLPSTFNNDLLPHNCTDLRLYDRRMRCGIAHNHGFGRPATELHRVLPVHMLESWFDTSQFALEPVFHRRILRHRCRTTEPESAAAFYIPFYAGLSVGEYLWTNDYANLDRDCKLLLRWIRNQTQWQRSNGSDHFTAIGRITYDFRRPSDEVGNWGSAFLHMPDMQRVTRLIIEKAPWDHRDVAVPYPTGFHPRTGETLENWQRFVRDYNRSSLFTFVGARRPHRDNDFRGLLLRYCSDESPSCRAVECVADKCSADLIMRSFLGSEFCLQPAGDSPTRKSVFDCMVAGSVPVFFWNATAYDQYGWFLPAEPESYSVFISPEEVWHQTCVIKQVLMKYSKDEIRRKREKVIETIPRIIYAFERSTDFKDAFDIALDGVLERIKKEIEWSSIT